MSRRRNLGRMRHRLAVMEIVRTPDGGGGTERADSVSAVIWARVKVASSREVEVYSKVEERVSYTAMIRAANAPSNGQTVYWLNRGVTEPVIGSTDAPNGVALYVVTSVDADPDGRSGEFVRLMLREGGNR